MTIVDIAVDAFAQGMVPGKCLVEFLPFLRHIPEWFPGAHSQRLWAKWQDAGCRLKDVAYTDRKVICSSPVVESFTDGSSRFLEGKKMFVHMSLGSSSKEGTMG